MNNNLFALFQQRFRDGRGKPFLTTPDGVSRTYGAVEDLSSELAGALRELGCVTGDRVVVQVDKSPEAVALYFACLRSGLVYVPINTAYTKDEVDYFLDDAQATVFVCDDSRVQSFQTTSSERRVVTLNSDGSGTLSQHAQRAEPFLDVVKRADEDLAALLYTSGTTGRSKGAMLTHQGLRENGLALHQVWAFEPGDVLLHILPIFHVHGLFVALHCAILNQSEVLFCTRFDPDTVVELLPRASVLMGVPTHYVRLLGDTRFSREACAHMRLFTSGSAPMTEQVFAQFKNTTGHEVCERYGMTECGIITSNPYDGDRVAGSVGFALPGYEIRVMGKSGPAAPGETGIVEARGCQLFAGYWQLPDKTAQEMTPDGFFRTGDVGSMDEAGRLTLAGRSGDMIISGGFNVYPKEIETVLDANPSVLESAVVGLPHPDFGEGVVAFIVTTDSAATSESTNSPASPKDSQIISYLQDACEASLARFKHPKHFVCLDELPRNTMGKVQKAGLRAGYAEMFTSSS